MEPCLFIGKSHVIVGCQMVTRIGGQRAFSLSKLLILILVSNLYIKWSYFWISDGFVYTQGGGGHLCLFLAKFIDFVKVLLNIRWCCEQGAPCLFFANAMLTKCCLNASSDNQADSTIGSCRYKKRHFNKTWNELIVCKYQLAKFWVFVQHNCKIIWGMTENYICKKAVLFLLIDNYHFTLACQKYFTQFSEWCWLQWLAGWW